MIVNLRDTGVMKYTGLVREMNTPAARSAYVITFGCQQNEADSEKLRGMLTDMGYTTAPSPEEADVIIMNTCAVRAHAENKVLSMLGKLRGKKEADPSVIIGVVGCMAAEQGTVDLLRRAFKYVSFTIEPNMISRLPEVMWRAANSERVFVIGTDKGDVVEGIPTERAGEHRAWVSVMYGCNNFCSYCIVPYVRGRERSRNSADVIAECRGLIDGGCREITLLGQNVNSYSSDTDFAGLLRRITDIPGDYRVRFMTSHPKDVSDALIDIMAERGDKIPPYFHLPLQSGSDRILHEMNRTYNREKYLNTVEKLRQKIPGIVISTDIIVGFPGETEEEFSETLDMLRTVRYDMVYAFIYSPREGTRAAKMDCQIPADVKSERIGRLLRMQDEISLAKNTEYVGTVQRVLADSEKADGDGRLLSGRTPGNKLVHFRSDTAAPGDFIKIKITRAAPFNLFGEPAEN